MRQHAPWQRQGGAAKPRDGDGLGAMLVDTHCHLDSPRLAQPLGGVLQAAADAGVMDLVVPGVAPALFDAQARAALSGDAGVRVHLAWGVHPQVLAEQPASQDAAALREVETWCEKHPPVAVGECGLDYRQDLQRAPKARQLRVLQWHLALATRLQRPVLLHCVAAHADLLAVLRSHGALPRGGVLHSYSGSAEQLGPLLQCGLMASFAGPVTWPGAHKAPRAAQAVPSDRLLVETDSPDQTPHPFKGTPNQPAYLPLVVDAVARARNEPAEHVAAVTTANARHMFDLTPH